MNSGSPARIVWVSYRRADSHLTVPRARQQLSLGPLPTGLQPEGPGYAASTICSKEAWSMTWLFTRVASIKRSETWK